MDRVLVDTDIALDLLLQREPFYTASAALFTLADRKKVKLYVSSLCFSNLDYIISKQSTPKDSRRLLVRFKTLVNVLSVDDKIISLSLSSDFKDFEDSIQYYVAIENSIPILLTRNLRDYKQASISVSTAEAYIKNRK